MRISFLGVLLLCLVAACQKPASRIKLDDGVESETAALGNGHAETGPGSAGEILDKAILAYGGSAASEKLKKCRVSYRTTMHMPEVMKELSDNVVITEDCYVHPDKLRRTVREDTSGKHVLLCVVNGNTMWLVSADGSPMSQPAPPVSICPAVISALGRLMQLRDSGQPARLEATEEIEGKRLVPLAILRNGIPQSTIYLDELSCLPMRELKQVIDARDPPESIKRAVLTETVYSDYKDFDGVVLPTSMRAYQAGSLLMEVELLEADFPENFPSELFEPLDEQTP